MGGLKERTVRITTEPVFLDDFTFMLDGVRYYMDKAIGEDKQMLAARALRELNAERKKIEALEKEIYKLRLKAAEYDGFLKAMSFKA